jgi:hypothetical protein
MKARLHLSNSIIRDNLNSVGIPRVSQNAVIKLNEIFAHLVLTVLKMSSNKQNRVTSDSVIKAIKQILGIKVTKSKKYQKHCDKFDGTGLATKSQEYYNQKALFYEKLSNCSFIKSDLFVDYISELMDTVHQRYIISDQSMITLHKGISLLFKVYLRQVVKTTLLNSKAKTLSESNINLSWALFKELKPFAKLSETKSKLLSNIFVIKPKINRQKRVAKSKTLLTFFDSDTQTDPVNTQSTVNSSTNSQDNATQSDIITSESNTQTTIPEDNSSQTLLTFFGSNSQDNATQSDVIDLNESNTQTTVSEDNATQSDVIDLNESNTQTTIPEDNSSQTLLTFFGSNSQDNSTQSDTQTTVSEDNSTQSDVIDLNESNTQTTIPEDNSSQTLLTFFGSNSQDNTTQSDTQTTVSEDNSTQSDVINVTDLENKMRRQERERFQSEQEQLREQARQEQEQTLDTDDTESGRRSVSQMAVSYENMLNRRKRTPNKLYDPLTWDLTRSVSRNKRLMSRKNRKRPTIDLTQSDNTI